MSVLYGFTAVGACQGAGSAHDTCAATAVHSGRLPGMKSGRGSMHWVVRLGLILGLRDPVCSTAAQAILFDRPWNE